MRPRNMFTKELLPTLLLPTKATLSYLSMGSCLDDTAPTMNRTLRANMDEISLDKSLWSSHFDAAKRLGPNKQLPGPCFVDTLLELWRRGYVKVIHSFQMLTLQPVPSPSRGRKVASLIKQTGNYGTVDAPRPCYSFFYNIVDERHAGLRCRGSAQRGHRGRERPRVPRQAP